VKPLAAEDIIFLHFKSIEYFAGSHGVQNQERIISVANATQQELFGEQ